MSRLDEIKKVVTTQYNDMLAKVLEAEKSDAGDWALCAVPENPSKDEIGVRFKSSGGNAEPEHTSAGLGCSWQLTLPSEGGAAAARATAALYKFLTKKPFTSEMTEAFADSLCPILSRPMYDAVTLIFAEDEHAHTEESTHISLLAAKFYIQNICMAKNTAVIFPDNTGNDRAVIKVVTDSRVSMSSRNVVLKFGVRTLRTSVDQALRFMQALPTQASFSSSGKDGIKWESIAAIYECLNLFRICDAIITPIQQNARTAIKQACEMFSIIKTDMGRLTLENFYAVLVYYAVRDGKYEMLSNFLDRPKNSTIDLKLADELGQTALHVAIIKNGNCSANLN